MHQFLTEVFATLGEAHEGLRAAVDSVPPELRQTRPAPENWSTAEVLEHLALVNRFFARRMSDAIGDARRAGLGREDVQREPLSAQIVQRMADRGNRRNARDEVKPEGKLDWQTAWEQFEQSQQQVISAATSGDGLALNSVRADHRFFGSLTIYQWVELVAGHELRHADQIREVGASLQRASS